MKEKFGATPRDARKKNMVLLLKKLRKRPYTYQEAAAELKLSATAVANISGELCDKGILCRQSDATFSGVGRPPMSMELNVGHGLFLLIDLLTREGKDIGIRFCNFCGECVFETSIKGHIGHLDELNEELRSAVENELAKHGRSVSEILSVCVAAPGIVDRRTGRLEMTSLQPDIRSYNIKEYLEQTFGVPTTIRSYIYLAAKNEYRYGKLKKSRVALLINIEVGIGIAMLIDGEPFQGAHGFYGEIGLVGRDLLQGGDSMVDRRAHGLDQEITFAAIKRRAAEFMGINDHDLSYAEFFSRMHSDKAVQAAFGEGAGKIAHFLENLLLLFDPDTVVFTGYVKEAKNEFLENLRKIMLPQLLEKVELYVSDHDATMFDALFEEAVESYIERCGE